MIRRMFALIAMTAAPLPAAAQGVSLQVGRLFDDGGWTAYSLSWTRTLLGPVGMQMGGSWLQGPRSSERLFGGMVDASLFRGGRPGAYVIGGVAAGLGTGAAESWWRSWSAGAGYELIPLPYLSIGVEGRYREMMPARRSGAELAFRIGTSFGSARTPRLLTESDSAALPRPAVDVSSLPDSGRSGDALPAPVAEAKADSSLPAVADDPSATAPVRLATAATLRGRAIVRGDAAALVREVIRIAEGEIGRRYQLGGRGEAGDGFDCSGLIQYAYARLGITLPRRSLDQATQGSRIEKRALLLRAGDILTFSSSGGRVTHVGLYMGDGRFIHSASKGVQVSRLTEDDPYGRWWHRRWVGVRRIVASDA